jgi:EmrB/QacA subfamily drug resistance transporter
MGVARSLWAPRAPVTCAAVTLQVTDASRPWWTLGGACTGLFVLMLDSTIIGLALPAIQRELDASPSGLQWVMNGYLLVIAALVVTGGRLGDIYGRRAVFTIGLAVFAGGSVLSGAASSEEALIAGRVVQGIGAAAMLPLSLAIVSDAFPGDQQARALGIWAAISALALAVGPLVGGLLVDVDWRLIFWINVPVLAVGVAVMLGVVPETRDETAVHRLDIAGLVLLAGGLIALVLPLVESTEWGLGSARTLGVLGLGAALLVAFWAVEHRVAQPIVEFALFRNGPYFGASAAAFALVGTWWSLIFFQPQYLEGSLGHSATATGLLILPVTAPMIVISPLAGRLIARFGARGLMTVGMLCGVAGLVFLTQITDTSGYGRLLPGYLLFGVALGLVYAPMSSAAMAAMPPAKTGIASGVLAMDRVLAGALGLAVTGAVFQSLIDDQSFPVALAHSTWVLVGLLAVGTVLTWLFVRSPSKSAPDPAVRPSERRHHLQHRFHV